MDEAVLDQVAGTLYGIPAMFYSPPFGSECQDILFRRKPHASSLLQSLPPLHARYTSYRPCLVASIYTLVVVHSWLYSNTETMAARLKGASTPPYHRIVAPEYIRKTDFDILKRYPCLSTYL